MKPEQNPILRAERRPTYLNSIKAMCGDIYTVDRKVPFTSKRGRRCKRTIKGKRLPVHVCGAGYKVVNIGSSVVRVHRLLAEIALGRGLPEGAEVHHVDGDRTNNLPGNLVICQDRSYHALLHARQEALEKTGDPNKRKCLRCGEYGDPEEMLEYRGRGHAAPRYSHRVSNGWCVPSQQKKSPEALEGEAA